MSIQFELSIVRIQSYDGKIVGAGFCIDESHVLTCAHVVDLAISRPINTPAQPRNVPIYLDFPLIESDVVLSARVVVWHPRLTDMSGDIALLALDADQQLPSDTRPMPLLLAHDLLNHQFETYGFPRGREIGVSASGIIRRETSVGWLQIEDTKVPGYRIQPGFSGSPIWDVELGGIVGMVVVADEGQQDAKSAFILPAVTIHETCSILPVRWPLGRLNNVPALPSHYLERSEELTELKSELLRNTHDKVDISQKTQIIGLQGMGGIGKTVLAAALALDPDIRKTFYDGIHFLTLGQAPILLARQIQLAQAYTKTVDSFVDVQQGKFRLGRLISGKRCLIILDDVWEVGHINAFPLELEKSQVLITTRNIDVIRSISAIEYGIHILSDADALKLLAKVSDSTEYNAEQSEEMLQVAQECGKLPLALAMIGSMVRGRSQPWADALRRLKEKPLDRISYTLPDYPYPNLLRAIRISIDTLERDEGLAGINPLQRYLDLAIFEENIPIPYDVLQLLWTSYGLDDIDVEDLIEAFVKRNLLRVNNDGYLTLHDLLTTFVRQQVTNPEYLHLRLVNIYRQLVEDDWSNGPKNDYYYWQYIAYHLSEAEQFEDLYALVRNRQFSELQGLNLPSNPLLQLHTLQIAIHAAIEQNNPRAMAEFVLLHIHRISRRQTTASLVDAVESGDHQLAWELSDLYAPEDSAMWHMILSWEAFDSDQTDIALATMQRLRSKSIPEISGTGQSIAITLLVGLCHYIPDISLRVADQLLNSDGMYLLVEALADSRLLHAAKESISFIKSADKRVSACCKVAQAQTRAGDDVNSVMQTMEYVRQGGQRDQALSTIANEYTRKRKMSSAKTIAGNIRNRWIRDSVRYEIAMVQLGSKDMSSALETAQTIWNGKQQDRVLNEILKEQARSGSFTDAIETAGRFTGSRNRDRALRDIALIQASSGDYEAASDTRGSIESPYQLCHSMIDVAKLYTECGNLNEARSSLLTAYKIALNIDPIGQREASFHRVAEAQISAGDIDAALKTTGIIRRNKHLIPVMGKIASALVSAGESDRAFQILDTVKDTNQHAAILSEIAVSYAREREIARAIEIATSLSETELHDYTIQSNVASVLVYAGKYDDAIDVVQMISNKESRSVLLHQLALEQLRSGNIAAAAKIAANIRKQKLRTKILQKIFRTSMQAEDFLAAKETAKSETNTRRRIDFLFEIALAQVRMMRIDSAQDTLNDIKVYAFDVPNKRDRDEILDKIKISEFKIGSLEETTGQDPYSKQVDSACHATSITDTGSDAVIAASESVAMIKDSIQRRTTNSGIAIARRGVSKTSDARQALVRYLTSRSEQLVPRLRPITLHAIALVQARSDDTSQAQQTLVKARKMIIDDDSMHRDRELTEIALTQTQIGDLTAAKDTTNHITSEKQRSIAISRIAAISAACEDISDTDVYQSARKSARAIRSRKHRVEALIELANSQAESGDFNCATDTAMSIEGKKRNSVLRRIALMQASQGDYSDAQNTISLIQPDKSRAHALGELAEVHAQAGDGTVARSMAQKLGYKDIRTGTLRRIAKIQLQIGDFEGAKQTAFRLSSKQKRPAILRSIAVAQADHGELTEAMRTTKNIKNLSVRANAVRDVAIACARIGDIDGALSVVGKIGNKGQKSVAVREVALIQARAGHIDAAQETAALISKTRERESTTRQIEALQEEAKDAASSGVSIETSDWLESVQQIRVSQIVAYLRTSDSNSYGQDEMIPEIVPRIVEAPDQAMLAKLLIPAAYYEEAAYSMCALLACRYPSQSANIVAIVSESNYTESI